MAAVRPEFTLESPPRSRNTSTSPSPTSSTTNNVFAHRFRYFILLVGCLCLTSICANMIALNFTLICMQTPKSERVRAVVAIDVTPNTTLEEGPNGISHILDHPTFDYSQKDKSMLMWAVAFGSIIGTFPFNLLYARFGARWVFFAAGLMSAIATLAIPHAAVLGFNWFLFARVFQGVAYSADFACIGVLTSRWASLKQNGFFLSILTCFSPLSAAVTNMVSGVLCESRFGWPSVYYSHGAVCLFLFLLWIIVYTDRPATHNAVSSTELEKIHRHKTDAHINMDSFIPYKAICRNPVVLTVWLNALADIGSGIFLLTYTPIYIKNVLNYGVAETGLLGALPAMAHIPFKLVCGYMSDKCKMFGERPKMLFFNTVALFIPGVMYAALGFIPDSHAILAIVLFSAIHGFLGANCGGFYKCGTLISRQYSAFVISNIQFIKCLTLFIAPALVAIFVTDDSSREQWRKIFLLLALVLIMANCVFCYMATDEPASFTNITRATVQAEQLEKKHALELTAAPDACKC